LWLTGTNHLAQALSAALAQHRDAVLIAPTGAGKSTLVPLALLNESWLTGKRLLLLEPRRLAARAVAQRMAALLGESVGETVGYRMRMDTRVSRRTRIEVITEGVLTRLLNADPALEGVGCLIFDEYHERNLQSDMGLALALDARTQLGTAVRIVVMSATLDGERVATLLDDAARVEVPGRSFPVEIHYLGRAAPLLPTWPPRPGADTLDRLTVAAVRRALTETTGDVLVFLPGAGEIRRAQAALAGSDLPNNLAVFPLYGELPAQQQDAALQPTANAIGTANAQRRIVLATNIAETSLTIAGITTVIDSGLVRRARFDPATGMSRLELERISRASSEQRAGRAGRTQPGCCYRLWSEGAQATLASETPPEILDADLAPLALELARWGCDDATTLRWLDAPPSAALSQARELLLRLQAVDEAGRITTAGRAMAEMPLHPRLAHMLTAARTIGAEPLAATLAAILSERDFMRGSAGAANERDPDLRTRVEQVLRPSRGGDPAVVQQIRRSAERLLERAQGSGVPGVSVRSPGVQSSGLQIVKDLSPTGWLLSQAFPDRIGQRRAGSEGRYLLASGRGAGFVGASSLARAEFIVAATLDDKEREARIDLAAPISREQLEAAFETRIAVRDTINWDARTETVLAVRRRSLDALLLEEVLLNNAPPESLLSAMLDGVRAMGLECLPWDSASREWCARVEFARRLERADTREWPGCNASDLLASVDVWLAPYLSGYQRRAHLARLPLTDALQERLTHAQRKLLDDLAPRTLTVPSGSAIHIDYEDELAPCVSVRLQEVFGQPTTPRVGGGTVPVTFKLLSPAQRPVQITRDLAGFWTSSYVEVRKDMRGRYPKHHWPENPLEAAPSRGARRRR
jgi:ATP-dependent helicase HrpB